MLRKVFAFLLSLAISLEDKSLVQRGKSRSLWVLMVWSLTCLARLMSMDQMQIHCMSSWKMPNMEHWQTTSNGTLQSFCVIGVGSLSKDILQPPHLLTLWRTLKRSFLKNNIQSYPVIVVSTEFVQCNLLHFSIIWCPFFFNKETIWQQEKKTKNANGTHFNYLPEHGCFFLSQQWCILRVIPSLHVIRNCTIFLNFSFINYSIFT